MKALFEYINSIFKYYACYYDLSKTYIAKEVESNINYFITHNYVNITKNKYVTIIYNPDIQNLELYINPKLKEEMVKHYPEKLI